MKEKRSKDKAIEKPTITPSNIPESTKSPIIPSKSLVKKQEEDKTLPVEDSIEKDEEEQLEIERQQIEKSLMSKQIDFCRELRVDNNATQAAIRAGYKPSSATSTGSRLLRYRNIQRYLRFLQKIEERHFIISKAQVLNILFENFIEARNKGATGIACECATLLLQHISPVLPQLLPQQVIVQQQVVGDGKGTIEAFKNICRYRLPPNIREGIMEFIKDEISNTKTEEADEGILSLLPLLSPRDRQGIRKDFERKEIETKNITQEKTTKTK